MYGKNWLIESKAGFCRNLIDERKSIPRQNEYNFRQNREPKICL